MRCSLTRASLAALGLLLAGPVIPVIDTPAQAQSIQIGPGGVRVDPNPDYRRGPPDRDYRRGQRWGVSEREAIRIARRSGLVEINRVVDAGRQWRVSGADRRGRFTSVVIDARSGNVIRIIRRG